MGKVTAWLVLVALWLVLAPAGAVAQPGPPVGCPNNVGLCGITVRADPTGTTDAEPAVAVAMTAACASTPAKSVFFPPGIYLFNEAATIPANCDGLTLYSEQNSATIRVGVSNVSASEELFVATGNKKLTFYGLIFDGNTSSAAFVGSISGNTLYVTSTTGGTLQAGVLLSNNGVAANTTLLTWNPLTQTGTVSGSPQTIGSGAMTAAGTSNTAGLLRMYAPMPDVTFDHVKVLRPGGTWTWLIGSAPIHGTTSAVSYLGQFTGAISGTTLTVTNILSGSAVEVGQVITYMALVSPNGSTTNTSVGVTANTHVTAFVSGTGGNGTYTVDNSQSVSAEPMTTSFNYLPMASVPAGVVPGSYLVGSEVDPDIYVTAINSPSTGDVTLNKTITDTVRNSTGLGFSFAFTTTADQYVNDTSFQTSSTLNLAAGEVLQVAGGSPCMVPGTTISEITTNVQVYFSPPLTCKIQSGTNIASAAGFPRFRVLDSYLEDIGINLFTGGSAQYVTSGPQSIGSTLTLVCYSGNDNPQDCLLVGLIPGNSTAATGLPTGVPVNDLVISSPNNISDAGGTFQATLQSPLTGSLPGATSTGSGLSGTTFTEGTVTSGAFAIGEALSGPGVLTVAGIPTTITGGSSPTWTVNNTYSTPIASAAINGGVSISWIVGQTAGNGYGVWHGYSAWWASPDMQFKRNVIRHAWSAPWYVSNALNPVFEGNTYRMDFLQTQLPNIAPSPCINPLETIGMKAIGEDCSGATGTGIEADHDIDAMVVGSRFVGNGLDGIYACGGRNWTIGGVIAKDNNAYLNYPITQQFNKYSTFAGAGIALGGSCTYNLLGYLTNTTIIGGNFSDDQTAATQNYGISHYNGVLNGLSLGSYQATGNVVANIDSSLNIPAVTTPGQPGFQVSLSTSQSVTSAQSSKVLFDTTVYDTNGAWTGASASACSQVQLGTTTGSSISGTTWTVGTLATGYLALGQQLSGAGITAQTIITANLSGTGSGSTWTVNNSQTVGSENINTTSQPGYCFDPKTAGKYKIDIHLLTTSTTESSGGSGACQIYKNGVAVHRTFAYSPGTSSFTLTPNCTFNVQMNGTTDYIEGWGEMTGTGSPGPVIVGGNNTAQTYSLMEGSYIGP